MLLLATVCWGISFPVVKSIFLIQQNLLPGANSWFYTSMIVLLRFGMAALLLLFWDWKNVVHCTRLEAEQGILLGLFGGTGILFQVDGLAYTSASNSAFLTQFYCLTIPVYTAIVMRRWPSMRTTASCLIVLAGTAVLAQLDWRNMHIGRGELETLLAAILFTGQIVLLEQPRYQNNRTTPFSFIMFLAMAACCLPVALWFTRQPQDWLHIMHDPALWILIGLLVVLCTMGAYMLMNHWQKHVTSTEAGLIYCSEPIFASLFALFLPAIFSIWAGISYSNERVSWRLVIGGGLITFANVLLHWPVRRSNSTQSAASCGCVMGS